MNILLIEADKVLGESSVNVLEAAGFKVTWKRSAQTGLDALDDYLPDIILLEIQLGNHNGIEFLYEINSYPEWQRVPIIIHTINPKAQDEIFKEAFKQLGVRDILYKPRTSTVQLVRTVKKYVLVK